METKIKKNKQKYSCIQCKYNTTKKTDYDRHLKTLKHINKLGINKQTVEKFFECNCGKSYKSRAGLWKHKKKCNSNNIIEKEEKKEEKKEEDNITLNKILEENKHLRETIQELVPKVGNKNNVNINIFLNNECKDAINFTEFIDSFRIGMNEIEDIKSNGIVDSISSLFLRELKQLDIYKRPIHCSNESEQNKIIYVKDDNTWNLDNVIRIKSSIDDIVQKHLDVISAWEKNNPEWSTNTALTEEYLQLVNNITVFTEDNKNNLIEDISKEVII